MRLLFSSFVIGHVETDIMILDYMFRLIKTILKSGTKYYLSVFGDFRINSERRLLAFSCLSVRLSAHISVTSPARIFVKFGFWEISMKICRDLRNLVEIGQKYRELHMQT